MYIPSTLLYIVHHQHLAYQINLETKFKALYSIKLLTYLREKVANAARWHLVLRFSHAFLLQQAPKLNMILQCEDINKIWCNSSAEICGFRREISTALISFPKAFRLAAVTYYKGINGREKVYKVFCSCIQFLPPKIPKGQVAELNFMFGGSFAQVKSVEN